MTNSRNAGSSGVEPPQIQPSRFALSTESADTSTPNTRAEERDAVNAAANEAPMSPSPITVMFSIV